MLELLDDLLAAISFFDLLTPTWGLLRTISHGGGFTFKVPHRAGFGIYSVEKILKQAGCNPVWGKEITSFDGGIMRLTVKREHAQRAYWALHKAGVPMENNVPKNAKRRTQTKRN